ncbi:hypothetical protein AVEN_206280-1, partial [Araneus ventricosus]
GWAWSVMTIRTPTSGSTAVMTQVIQCP